MPRFLHTEKRRVNTAAVVKKLARQVNAKLAELNKLQADHSELLHNQALLTTVCEHLAWIRAQKVAAACDGVEQAIDEAELELLQQLGAAPAASGESNSSSMSSSSVLSLGPREDSSSAADGTTISPASDPLQLLRHLITAPPLKVMDGLTLESLRSFYAAMVRELAFNLQLLGAAAQGEPEWLLGSAGKPAQPARQVQVLMTEYMQLQAFMSLTGQGALAMTMMVTCCETGEELPGPGGEQHVHAMRQLGLSQPQLQRLHAGVKLFSRILHPSQRELQRVQAELQQTTLAETTASEAGAASRARRLELQAQRTKAIDTAMSKEFMIRTIGTAFVYGCFSWEQLAKLHVLCYPRSPTPALVVMAAMEVLRESDAATADAAASLQQQAKQQLEQQGSMGGALGTQQVLDSCGQQQLHAGQHMQQWL